MQLRNSITLVHRTFLAVALVACCADDHPGTGGGGDGPAAECPEGYEPWALVGARLNVEDACVEVSGRWALLPVQVCRDPVSEKTSSQLEYYCLLRVMDGERFWVMAERTLIEPPLGWEFCSGAPSVGAKPPPPCFTGQCETYREVSSPLSICSEEATRAVYGCGGMTRWDENCCRRPPCHDGEDCPPGFECRMESKNSPWGRCWTEPGSSLADLSDPESCKCDGMVDLAFPHCFPL